MDMDKGMDMDTDMEKDTEMDMNIQRFGSQISEVGNKFIRYLTYSNIGVGLCLLQSATVH